MLARVSVADNRNVVVVSTTTAPSVEVVPNKEKNYDLQERDPGVSIMNPKPEDRPTSFFAQPGILAGKEFLHIFIYVMTIVAMR